MRRLRQCTLIAALSVAATPWLCVPAAAQFGLYSLPTTDFIWHWGNARREGKQQGFADLDLQGSEAAFNCHLTARLRASADLSPTQRRQLESDLRSRLDFIYATSQEMNYLEQTGGLDWATLDCKRPEPPPVDEAKKAERESAAREKMLRELERRRAKQRDSDN